MNYWKEKSKQSLFNEIWVPIPGYLGRYEVSNLGRVKKLSLIERGGRNKIHPERIVCQILRRGYLSITLFDEHGKSYQTKTHRLVALAFIPNSNNKPYINHKDFNRQNNSPENLEWVTPQENTDHMKLNGRTLIGTSNPAAVLNEESVIKIKASRMKVKELAELYNVSIPTIEAIRYGRTWKHLM